MIAGDVASGESLCMPHRVIHKKMGGAIVRCKPADAFRCKTVQRHVACNIMRNVPRPAAALHHMSAFSCVQLRETHSLARARLR
jgi:hypothetical protein